jgi:hypothetical protein
MPFYLSLSMFLMSVSFFLYGLLLHDFFIYVRFKFPIVGCSYCLEGCLTVCLLVVLILVCFSISDSKRDWNHIGYHTAVAVCLLQKRIKRGRQAATASHTYMTVPTNKVHCRSCGNFSGVYSRCFILLLYAWNSEEKLDLSVLNGAMGGL